MVGLLFICTLIELVSMWNLTKVEIQLCNMLSPEGPKVSLDSYNWGLVSVTFNTPNNFRNQRFLCDNFFCNLIFVGLQFQVFIAVLVDNFLYPISAFRSHFSQSINWSGIRYYLRDGKISKVHATHSVNFFFLSFTFAVFRENSPCQMILDVSSIPLHLILMALQIERENSSKYTDLGGKHLYGKRTYPPNKSLVGYLSRTLAQWHQPKKYDV